MLVASFWIFTLFGCTFVAVLGGRDGRCFATMFVAGVVLTIPAQMAGNWQTTQLWVMAIDTLFFIGVVRIMLRSVSYWPIWAAASQLMTVLTHVATLLLQTYSDRIYEGLSTVWVIPLMLFTIIGIEQDRKHKDDRAYSPGSRTA